jgi:WD40 repeat protein
MVNSIEGLKVVSLDDFLDKFVEDDSEELLFAIEALKSLTDSEKTHVVHESLKERIQHIQLLINEPPEGLKREEILEKVALKIDQLSKKEGIVIEDKFIPSFTEDSKTNLQIYTALLKLFQSQVDELNQEKGALELYTPLEGQTDFDSKEQVDVLTHVLEFLKSDKERCLLLMGDSGAGKTTFCYYLLKELLKVHEKGFVKNQPIPILIPLITIENVEKNLIQEYLRQQKLEPEDIKLLKEHFSFIFILESYDERNVFKNFYHSNRLDEWDCKVLTSCRSQALLHHNSNYHSLFSPGIKGGPLNELILCPFKEKEIKQYLKLYVTQNEELEWSEEEYLTILSQLPDVVKLISNPFVLSMIVRFLPELVQKYGWKVSSEFDEKEEKPIYEKMSLTQAELYDSFIEAWFARQLKKLKKDDKELSITKEDLFKFNQMIAQEMLAHQTQYLELKESKIKELVDYLKSTSRVSNDKKEWQEEFLDTKDETITLLRSGWLLKKFGKKRYVFLHDSLRSHFAAKHLFHGILSRSTFALGHPLNGELKSEIIDSLADRVNTEPGLKNLLFELIETSKYEPFVAYTEESKESFVPGPAANAMTILNRAGVCFSGLDLSGVRIAGADLSRAFLNYVKFVEADLRRIKLVESSIVGADFTGACMDDIEFGMRYELHFQERTNKCIYSPNGKHLVVTDDGGYIHLYDAVTYRLIKSLKNTSFSLIFNHDIKNVCFSHDSRFVAISNDDGLCRIWDVVSGKLLRTLKSSSNDWYNLSFSHDDKLLISVTRKCAAFFWNVDSGKIVRTIELEKNEVQKKIAEISWMSCFSPDGKTFASVVCDRIRVWDLSDGEELIKFEATVTFAIYNDLAFDGKTLILVGHDFDVWDVNSGKRVHRFGQGATLARISPDGQTLATATGKAIELWDIASGKLINTLECSHFIRDISFHPDGTTLVAAEYAKIICLWALSHKNFKTSERDWNENEGGYVISENGKIIASCRLDTSGKKNNDVVIKDAISGNVLRTFEGYSKFIRKVALSADGKMLALENGWKSIELWEISSGQKLADLDNDNYFKFTPDGKSLVLVSEDIMEKSSYANEMAFNEIKLWNIFSKKISCFEIPWIQEYDLEKNCICFSPNSESVAIGNEKDNTVRLFSLLDAQEMTFKGHTKCVTSLCYSPDGKILGSVSEDKTLKLWDVSSGKELHTCKGHIFLCSIIFSRDNKTVVSAGDSIRLWDISSGQCLHILPDFRGYISIAWDFTEQQLIAIDILGSIRHYKMPKNLKEKPPLLVWSSHRSPALQIHHVIIKQVTGLSSNNLKLLEQKSCIGQVSQKSSKDIIFARDEMESVGESCQPVFGWISEEDIILLTPEKWLVSLAYKPEENLHAFLILEGIENGKRVIKRAEVFLDTERKTQEYQIPFYGKLGFGYAYVQVKPITSRDAQQLAKQCHFRSEEISKKQADELLDLIYQDADKKELTYNNLGDSQLYGIALKGEYGNCLTFAEKWLEGIKVKFVEEKNWKTTLLPFDITNQRPYLNSKSKKKEEKGDCSIQ